MDFLGDRIGQAAALQKWEPTEEEREEARLSRERDERSMAVTQAAYVLANSAASSHEVIKMAEHIRQYIRDGVKHSAELRSIDPS